ncbi:collagenase [Kitasatospora sp. NPDC127111]|uniref:collagenase n=1 Tax=Kitasatospora sp. NPDC127111 TaxID=3345363 RepID=UPI00363307FD
MAPLPHLARLLTIALALLLAVGLFAPRSQAAPVPASPQPGGSAPAAPTDPGPQPGSGTAPEEHGKNRPVPARDRAPLSATAPTEGAGASANAKAVGQPAPAATAATCTVGDFTGRTGSALVQQITSVDLGCVNGLFSLTGTDAAGAFRESQMVTVADALRDSATTYPGNNTAAIGQLVLYLRAGYFVQWYHPADVGSYGTALQTSIRGALDAFFANPHSRDVTSDNAGTLGEAVVLIDSAQENARYLYVVKRMLADYDSATHNPAGMGNALNGVFTVLWRGHQLPAFVTAVQADPSVLDSLYAFATANNAQLGGDYTFLVYNAARELGRFLQYAPLQAKARPLAKGLADQSSPAGRTAYQWSAVAEMVDAHDAGNCSYYGTCDAANRLKAANLTVTHTCSPSIRILAQALDQTQLTAACSSLTGQDAFFHAVAKDGGPVADDRNTTIEVVVFHSRFDYGVFAAMIYGINTNNGGMYLEGNPAAAGNQPRFLAYEAEWARPDFQIWNLNHEYTHYLDGRFDMYGDFNAGMVTPTVWWVEGFAEYVSYSYRKVTYDAAMTAAGRHTYRLSTLFDTTYDNADTERVYRWGYLAVRFMLEQHRADMDAVLAKYRAGDWNGARAYLTSTIGTRYDAAFDAWLTACANGSCPTGTTPPGNRPPTAAFTTAVGELAVTFVDRSTDPDGRIVARAWDFGDGTTSTNANPTKWYTAAGTYTVTLTVTDDKGATASTRQNVTVARLPECSGADTRQLDRNCRRGNVAAATGDYAHFYLYVPAGTKQLKVSSTGGTGNADLYYNKSSWAYTNAYTSRSTNQGSNTETLTVTNPPAGYVYFSLYAQQGFSGVDIKAEY